jgi:WhiB family redox-sensing transcriptional regulator
MSHPTEPDHWRNAANCIGTDPELFFPETNQTREANRVCRRCDVFLECLNDALQLPPHADKHGIRAATGPRQRAVLRRNRTKLARFTDGKLA